MKRDNHPFTPDCSSNRADYPKWPARVALALLLGGFLLAGTTFLDGKWKAQRANYGDSSTDEMTIISPGAEVAMTGLSAFWSTRPR